MGSSLPHMFFSCEIATNIVSVNDHFVKARR
jgi:hypothetical protein